MENTLKYSDLSKNININDKSYFGTSMTNTEIKKMY